MLENILMSTRCAVWYTLYTCPDHCKWPNVLQLCQLVFSLPFTTTHVERMFSSLKLIKTDRRTSMGNTTLSDIMEVYLQGPSLEDFHADAAIQLWWEGCKTNRRPNQRFRKQYRARETEELAQDDSTSSFSLDDWDVWHNPLSPSTDSFPEESD